ncbi:MAG TPA: helix-hairpin-helix domain-containing protein [archaeon]|nr:helix-hairpin-helix domain-containing protein [archaeon]
MQRSRSVRPAPGTERRLLDLISVGPATVRDLHRMGIRTVPQLARCTPESLYAKLNRLTGKRQDPCCLDVFSAAVAQARNPSLPQEKCVWWYWSRQRKENHKGR